MTLFPILQLNFVILGRYSTPTLLGHNALLRVASTDFADTYRWCALFYYRLGNFFQDRKPLHRDLLKMIRFAPTP